MNQFTMKSTVPSGTLPGYLPGSRPRSAVSLSAIAANMLDYELPSNHQAASKRNKRGLKMKSRPAWLSIALFILVVSASLFAQDTASITGTVTDPSGAAVKGAQVRVSSPDRGIDHTAPTNDSGDYLVAGLPPGPVNVTVTAPGFKKYEAKGVILRVAQKARNDVALQVGTTSTEVTVEGTNVAQVETQSSDLAGTVTGKQISQ